MGATGAAGATGDMLAMGAARAIGAVGGTARHVAYFREKHILQMYFLKWGVHAWHIRGSLSS